ncbi:MAG TPA: hypothetical protein DHC76_18240 [Rhodobacteraceae bacterium]|jgi:hypothetical protein|nr:hypothetical protein RB2083_3696 [Rhodobacteraceae bacterium HTCC2083]HCW85928.1 hypothetical protein [Paracoccaceae bacterium]
MARFESPTKARFVSVQFDNQFRHFFAQLCKYIIYFGSFASIGGAGLHHTADFVRPIVNVNGQIWW